MLDYCFENNKDKEDCRIQQQARFLYKEKQAQHAL